MSTDLRGSARDGALAERARAVPSNQVQEGQFRFAAYFVIGLAVIGVGAAIASFMPLP
ncbi:MAG TPA: hypothetical protein VN821_16195 [Candidatus Udaeobacter sp.]|nr:hypothetical protein [Candidatus Udaeobacter sp.]